MDILVIQCYQGNSKGEILSQHVKDREYFYYNFNEEALNGGQDFNGEDNGYSGSVLVVQFDKKDKKIFGMSIATYSRLKKIYKRFKSYKKNMKDIKYTSVKNKKSKNSKNRTIDGLLKISNIKEIKSKDYEEVKEIIKELEVNLLNEGKKHCLKYITIEDDDYKKLDGLAISIVHNKHKKKKKYKQEILDSFERIEGKLSRFAQRSRYAERVKNKIMPIRENRTEYQRDWERIIHSKAFRRLEDKAQIYTLSKGDHFRTRLTHTLEVTQIARGIARELELNEDLVEAIALGHDLGHTPFGHVGERTLDNILQENKIDKSGGFKHNYQGVRVVNYLEEKYAEFEGLNLTYQVMEGILKHTKTCEGIHKDKDKVLEYCTDCVYGNSYEYCTENPYIIGEFLCGGEVEKFHLNQRFSATLEGQVVAVADEIAQRAHDIDDGIASGIINVEEFLDSLKKDDLFKDLKEKIDGSLNYIKKYKRDYIDVLDIKRARIVSDVITYFMDGVVAVANTKIEEYKAKHKNNLLENRDNLVIEKKLIRFDDRDQKTGKFRNKLEEVRKKLEEITSNKIINSEEVNCFDGKGAYIINKLYKAYCKNPRQMPTTALKKFYREISKYTNDVVDIRNGKKDLVEEEIKIYNGIGIDNELKKLKQKIFIRCTVDLIAGMTDDFANKQFEKLYSPRKY